MTKRAYTKLMILNAPPRIVWLDMAKGIAICLVVLIHYLQAFDTVWTDAAIRMGALFHIPLFFVLAGYNFRREASALFVENKIRALLIPYVAMIMTLFAFDWLMKVALGVYPTAGMHIEPLDLLFGGEKMRGIYEPFWFISCLFLCQLAYHMIDRYTGDKAAWLRFGLIGLGGITACLLPLVSHLNLPLAVQVVPMALVFFAFGAHEKASPLPVRTMLLFTGCVAIACGVLGVFGLTDFVFSMQKSVYGPLFLGPLLAIGLSWLVMWACQHAAQTPCQPCDAISCALTYLGRAALMIMAVHQFVHLTIRQVLIVPEWVILPLMFAVPLAMFALLQYVPMLKEIYLGKERMAVPLASPVGSVVGGTVPVEAVMKES